MLSVCVRNLFPKSNKHVCWSSIEQTLGNAHSNFPLISVPQYTYRLHLRDPKYLLLMLHCYQKYLDMAWLKYCNLGNSDKQKMVPKCENVSCTIIRNPSTDANASVARIIFRASWEGNVFAMSSTDEIKIMSSEHAFKSGMSLAKQMTQ